MNSTTVTPEKLKNIREKTQRQKCQHCQYGLCILSLTGPQPQIYHLSSWLVWTGDLFFFNSHLHSYDFLNMSLWYFLTNFDGSISQNVKYKLVDYFKQQWPKPWPNPNMDHHMYMLENVVFVCSVCFIPDS